MTLLWTISNLSTSSYCNTAIISPVAELTQSWPNGGSVFMPQEIPSVLLGSCMEVGAHICLIICHEPLPELLLCISPIKKINPLYMVICRMESTPDGWLSCFICSAEFWPPWNTHYLSEHCLLNDPCVTTQTIPSFLLIPPHKLSDMYKIQLLYFIPDIWTRRKTLDTEEPKLIFSEVHYK